MTFCPPPSPRPRPQQQWHLILLLPLRLLRATTPSPRSRLPLFPHRPLLFPLRLLPFPLRQPLTHSQPLLFLSSLNSSSLQALAPSRLSAAPPLLFRSSNLSSSLSSSKAGHQADFSRLPRTCPCPRPRPILETLRLRATSLRRWPLPWLQRPRRPTSGETLTSSSTSAALARTRTKRPRRRLLHRCSIRRKTRLRASMVSASPRA